MCILNGEYNTISLQKELKEIIEYLKVDIVGSGELIVKQGILVELVEELSRLQIRIVDTNFWYFVDDKFGQNCSYGMGGPKSRFYDGWYSELQIRELNTIKAFKNEAFSVSVYNTKILDTIQQRLLEHLEYMPGEFLPSNENVAVSLCIETKLSIKEWSNE